MSNEKLEWNVLRVNINTKRIEIYNIFDHYHFRKDCDSLGEHVNEPYFKTAIKDYLMYYFWSKYEWEIFIQENSNSYKKMDVYAQVMMNWDKFIDYVSAYYISRKQQ